MFCNISKFSVANLVQITATFFSFGASFFSSFDFFNLEDQVCFSGLLGCIVVEWLVRNLVCIFWEFCFQLARSGFGFNWPLVKLLLFPWLTLIFRGKLLYFFLGFGQILFLRSCCALEFYFNVLLCRLGKLPTFLS